MASLLCRVEKLEDLVAQLLASEGSDSFYVTLWAEQNGAIVNNRWNYSWGNGNEHTAGPIGDWGYVTHFPWELISMSVGSRLSNTADTEVEMTVDGVSIGQSVVSSGTTTKSVNNNVNHVGFAGETINFRTLSVGGGNDVVVSAIIKFTRP